MSTSYRDLHRAHCGTCCFIAPPDLLSRLAKEGSAEQRNAAVNTIASSASMRTRRAIFSALLQKPETRDAALALIAPPPGERRTVYDVEHGGRSSLPGQKVRGEGDPESGDPAVNEAYDGADKTYDFYNDVYGRNSIDGEGMELISCVHYSTGYDNAFWDGSEMVYGDGSGEIFVAGAFTRSIDVIGHELTHGVTQFTSGLEYHTQPGALNEHFSDAMGSLVKQYSLGQTADQADWLIGAGTLVPALGQALRSMKAPGTAYSGDRQPDHMRNYADLPDDGNPDNDNGGVHINSGIPNKAFSLVAEAIGGNAWEKAGRIWYETFTGHLQPTSEFVGAAQATVEVAGTLFGQEGAEQEAVQSAWQTVGVLS